LRVAATVMFVHGAWVTSSCWDAFRDFFEDRGVTTMAPGWPGKERTVAEIRADPSPLAGLGAEQIIEHYAALIARLDEPPALIGHCFGGLFVQVLLARGLGSAGIAISSAPPRGVLAWQPSVLRSLAGVLARPSNRSRVVYWSYERFRYAVAHTLPDDQASAAYERHVTPETGRIFFQNALSAFDRSTPFAVDFTRPDRGPLLLMAAEQDRIVPPSVSRANYGRYTGLTDITDFIQFADRAHWIIGQDGWEEVAAHACDWLTLRHAM
jgi:pimeloyl-ACP methyl ester carboxylesterase